MREPRQVISRRYFRNNPAEFFVFGNLRRHFARQQVRADLRLRSRRIATAVSSQDVSIANTVMARK